MNFGPTLSRRTEVSLKFDYSSDKQGGISFAAVCNLAGCILLVVRR